MASSLASPGVGSGLDVNSIVSQLMSIESQPVVALQTQQAKLQAKLSSVGQLQSLVSAFQDALTPLKTASSFAQTTATSSDSTSVSASSGGTATPGSYSVAVQALAASQTLVSASGQFSSPTSVVGTGTLTIQLGSFNAGQTTFTPNAGSSAVSITIDSTSNTLQGIRDKINAANAGVTASIITDVNGSRLSFTSTATGAQNGFTVAVTETGAAGLARLGYNPPGGVNQMVSTQSAANSQATINGIAVTSATNSVTTALQGVTLNLSKVTTSPVTVTVSNNLDAVTGMLSKLASAYNDLNKFLSDQTRYDPQSKQAGLFQGDSAVERLQVQLRGLVSKASTASSVFATLSSIGLEMQKDGSLKVNMTKVAAAEQNLPELTKALSAASGGAPGSTGIATTLASWTGVLLSAAGALPSETTSLQKSIAANQKQQDSLTSRLALTEQRLRARYSALDVSVSQYKSLNNYVAQQFFSNKSSSS